MALEIERKFLLTETPEWLEDCNSNPIQQGYIALEADTEVRIRRHGGDHSLTIKRGRGLARTEVELGLDEARFEALWSLTEGRRVSKRRHLVPHGDLNLEVDIYDDDLAGLRVAEVEFSSIETSERFAPPPWLGLEVTDDDRYKNRSLAEHGCPP